MAGVFDYKKEYKDLYSPKASPSVIDVPDMVFIMVDGKGNPNTSEEYQTAVEILYGLSYTIKMSNKSVLEYVVPPLEGLWWGEDGYFDGAAITDKNKLSWTAMIRQPDFMTKEVFEAAKTALAKKKPKMDTSKAQLIKLSEGLCVQIMHIGSYDDEPTTIEIMERYSVDNGYAIDISDTRRHHEIYLSDPRKVEAKKLKTVIRHPIRKI